MHAADQAARIDAIRDRSAGTSSSSGGGCGLIGSTRTRGRDVQLLVPVHEIDGADAPRGEPGEGDDAAARARGSGAAKRCRSSRGDRCVSFRLSICVHGLLGRAFSRRRSSIHTLERVIR
jgi:hypothetical protein